MSPAYLRNKCSFLFRYSHLSRHNFFIPSTRSASKTRVYNHLRWYKTISNVHMCMYWTTAHSFVWFKWKSNGVGLNASLHHQSTNTTCFSVKLQCENQSVLHFFRFSFFSDCSHVFFILPRPAHHIAHSIRVGWKANLNEMNRTNAKPINFDCDIYTRIHQILPLRCHTQVNTCID